MNVFAIIGMIVTAFFVVMIIAMLPWTQWRCGIFKGHEYETQGSRFFWLIGPRQVCKHCGKIKK